MFESLFLRLLNLVEGLEVTTDSERRKQGDPAEANQPEVSKPAIRPRPLSYGRFSADHRGRRRLAILKIFANVTVAQVFLEF
jgi:hypothetical protein